MEHPWMTFFIVGGVLELASTFIKVMPWGRR